MLRYLFLIGIVVLLGCGGGDNEELADKLDRLQSDIDYLKAELGTVNPDLPPSEKEDEMVTTEPDNRPTITPFDHTPSDNTDDTDDTIKITDIPISKSRIAYSSNGEIFSMKPDGSDKKNLTNHLATDIHPSWSPDRTKIMFQSDRGGGMHGIFMLTANGIQHPLDLSGLNVVWSPNDGQIAFELHDGIYISGVEAPRLLYIKVVDDAFHPTWSPNGDRLAFEFDHSIWIMDTIGKNPIFLTAGYEPAWSPNGQQIAFLWIGEPNGKAYSNFDIFVVDITGKNRTNLTKDLGRDESPTWSPDGQQIAFASWRNDSFNWEIYVMNADGSGQRNLTNDATADDIHPSW